MNPKTIPYSMPSDICAPEPDTQNIITSMTIKNRGIATATTIYDSARSAIDLKIVEA